MNPELLVIVVPAAVFTAVLLLMWAIGTAIVEPRRLVLDRVSRHANLGDVAVTGTGSLERGVLRQRRQFSGVALFDALLGRTDFAERAMQELARGDVPLRVGEYLMLRWLCAVLGLAVAWGMGAVPVVILVAGVIGYYLPVLYVRRRQAQRLKRLEDQLVDSLTLISNAVKSGHSFLQGIEIVAREMPAPSAQEYGQVVQEVSIGSDLEEALRHLAARVPSYDVDIVVTAMIIQRQVGGNLGEVLDAIVHTIRERQRVLREVRTRTAAARLTGLILGALPLIVGFGLTLINGKYMAVMFEHPLGPAILVVVGMMQVAGFLVIRKIVNIRV